MIEWKFNAKMHYQGEYHDMFVDGEYVSCWIQRENELGTEWRFFDGLSTSTAPQPRVFPVRHTFAEAQTDGVAWWAEQQLEKLR